MSVPTNGLHMHTLQLRAGGLRFRHAHVASDAASPGRVVDSYQALPLLNRAGDLPE